MPIVEYKCESCHKRVDILQKLNEKLVLTCPYCREDTLVKLFSAPSFVVKGGYTNEMRI